MKVLVISTIKYGKNGVTNVILNNYKYIDRDIKMDFVFPNQPDTEMLAIMEENNSNIIILSNRNKNPLDYYLNLSKVMKNGNYDIVHIHGNSHTLAIELIAAKNSGIKVRIPHAHSTVTEFPFLHKLLTNAFNYNYTHGVACGIDAGKWLYDDDKFMVIENGIEVDKYKFNEEIRNEIRNQLEIGSETFLIGHVGSFSETKNQLFLIQLFQELLEERQDSKLLLVGEGKLKAQCEKYVSENSLSNKVIFYGLSSKVNELMMGMDVLVMPSIYEGLPLTLVEAQATDLKCVISDTITREVNISNSIKFFSLTDRLSSTIDTILALNTDPKQRKEHKLFSLIRDSKYNIKNSAKKLSQIYKKL